MKLNHAALTLMIALGLSACVKHPLANTDTRTHAPVAHVLSKQQCMKLNMFKQGRLDGEAGQPNQFRMHHQNCGAHHVQLKSKQYQQGWKRGNFTFCHAKKVNKLAKQAVCENLRNTTKTQPRLSELESQLQDVLENQAQVNTDLDFFRDGVVHEQRAAQLQQLTTREQQLRGQIRAIKQAKLVNRTHLA